MLSAATGGESFTVHHSTCYHLYFGFYYQLEVFVESGCWVPGRTPGVRGAVVGIATLVERQKNAEYVQGVHPHSENDNILISLISRSA